MTDHQHRSGRAPGPPPDGDADHRLRARLQAHDPARHLPPEGQGALAARLEDAMTQTPDGYATRSSGARHRSPLTWLVAAATVAVLVAAGWVGLRLGAGADDAPQAGPPSLTQPGGPDDGPDSSTSPEPGPLTLALPGAAAGRCMVPTAAALANQELAFEGTVDDVADGRVLLTVDRWYRGGEAARVELPAIAERLQRAVVAPDFVAGRTYLVSATDGQVTLCGFTDRARPSLRAIYDEAFGTPR